MSEERKVNLVFAAENQTKGTLNEIKQDVAGTAAGIEQSGKKAAKGIEGLGEAVKKAGKESEDGLKKFGDGFKGAGEKSKQGEEQVSQAARSMIQSIQRTTAAAEAGEKGTAKYFEFLANKRGVGGDVLEPYLAQLRAAESAQAAATAGLGKMGVSAGQTQAALRQLPAQFSDIFVSLQGGQAPLTVFLQQGAQIKDSFGGAGEAAKAMSGYVLGMVNPMTVAAGAVALLGIAYHQGSQEADAFTRSIVLTGNASGVTMSQLREYAREIDSVVGTQAQAASGLADFVAAGVRGADELRRYTQTAIEWEKATGQAVSKTAEQFADLQKDPLAAVIKLNEGTNFLTASVYEQIRALDDQGRKADASKVAMEALDGAMRERSKTIRESLGYIERGWNAIKGAAAEAWDSMLNVGRAATIGDRLSQATAELERKLTEPLAVDNAAMRASREKGIESLRKEIWALQEKADAEKMAAAVSAESARVMGARGAFDKEYAKALDKEATLQEKLTKARNEAKEAGKSEADIKRVLAYVTEEHNKANKGSAAAARAAKKELADQAKVYADLAGVSSTYYADLARGEKQLAKGEITRDQYIKYVEDLIKKQPFAIALAKEEEKARKDLQKAIEDDIKQADRVAEKRQAGIKSIEDALLKARQEEEAHALAAAANITLAEAMERLTIARLEDHLAQARAGAESQATIDALERELRARKELQGVLQQKGVREANEKAAKEIEKEWDKTSELIGRTLSDYIMGSGKDAAQYLKRLFATLILQPVVQYGVNSAMGALGMGQQGSAVQSVLGGNNVGSTVLNNAGAIGAGYQAAFGASVGASSASLLGANAVGLMGGDAIGTLAAANGMWAGVATSASQAAVAANLAMEAGTAAALEAGTLSAAASGAAASAGSLMSGFMAAAPWVAGAVALLSVIKGFDDSGTPHSGAGAVYSKATGVQSGAGIYNQSTFGMGHRDEYSEAMQAGISGIAQGLGQTLDAFAVSFGKTAGYSVATAFADDSSKDGSWGSLKIADELGQVLINWEDSRASKWAPREFADGEAGYKEYLNAVAVDVKNAFVAMDLPTWADQILATATDIDTLNAALQQISTAKSVFEGLGKTMSMFADLSGDLQTRLLAASGGIDALASNAGAFYESFYTEGERALKQRELQMAALAGMGLSIDPYQGDAAKEAFRKTVEEAMASGQVEMAAQLLAMSGDFAAIADYAQKAGSAVGDVADVLSAVMRDLLGGRKSLEAELLRAQGDESGYLAAVRSIATAGYAEAEIAAWDYNTALQSQIDALDAAADRAAEVTSERVGLERQLLQMQSDLSAIRMLELDALDPSNRALQERIHALQDEQAALSAFSGAMSGLDDARFGLEQQMLVAQGRAGESAALQRARDLDRLLNGIAGVDMQAQVVAAYDYNAALRDQITALESATAAQKDAQAAAYRNLQAAVGRERDYWQQIASASQATIGTLSSALGLLKSNAADLYGTAESAAQWQAAQGMVFIEDALAAARRGASMTGFDGLQDAITAARSGIGAGVYATQFERDRDALVLAGQLSELGGLTEAQLTTQERSLKAAQTQIDQLDQTLKYWQDALSLESQQINATLSVGQAVAALQATMGSVAQALAAGKAAAATVTGGGSVASGGGDSGSVSGGGTSAAQKAYADFLMTRPGQGTADEIRAYADGLQDIQAIASMVALMGDPHNRDAWMLEQGFSGSQNIANDEYQAWAKRNIPGFASGGLHTGGLRLVGERGWELEATGPARIWNQQQLGQALQGGGGNTERLERLVEVLTVSVQRLEALAGEGNRNTAELLEITDQKSEGGNADRVELMNVDALAKAVAKELAKEIA